MCHIRWALLFVPCIVLGMTGSASAAQPRAGIFEAHDHHTPGANWHIEADVARSRRVVRSLVLYSERCDETIAGTDVPIAADGSITTADGFAADRGRSRGRWSLRARFTSEHELVGGFRITDPTCDSGSLSFTAHHATHGGQGDPPADDGMAIHDGPQDMTMIGDMTEYPSFAGKSRTDVVRAKRLVWATKRNAWRFDTTDKAAALDYSASAAMSPVRRPGFVHFRKNGTARFSGDVLNPRAPQALVFWCPSTGPCQLAAFMYRAPSRRRPPTFGGLMSWHRHGRGTWMSHVWLTWKTREALARCAPMTALEWWVGIKPEPARPDVPIDSPCSDSPTP